MQLFLALMRLLRYAVKITIANIIITKTITGTVGIPKKDKHATTSITNNAVVIQAILPW